MKKFVLLFLALALALGFVMPAGADEAGSAEAAADRSARAYPVADRRGIVVENEDARRVDLYTDDSGIPVPCFIIPDGLARLRLEIAASDAPDCLVFTDLKDTPVSLTDMWDPERGAFVWDQAAEGAVGCVVWPFNRGCVFDRRLGEEDPDIIRYYLVPNADWIDAVLEDLSVSRTEHVTRVWADPAPAEEPAAAPSAYILHAADQDGRPLPGVFVKFCTDAVCNMTQTGEDGIARLEGEPDVYHIQILKVPDGCRLDASFELTVGPAPGEWLLVIPKD